MKYKKAAVSLPDQVSKLKERGLQISDDRYAERFLSNISYYRLRAYTFPYQDNDNPNHLFIGKVSFKDIIELYTFDRKLRMLVFDAIERIEIALRTQIIHHFALEYGSHWHLDQSLYKEQSKFIRHLSSLQKEINRSNETFIDHYKTKYTSPPAPPCWMSLEVTSIGLLSLIFQNLKNCPEKKAVAHHFGLYSPNVLESWMHNFCNIRNICAHHGRLWNRRISIPIAMPRKTAEDFIENKRVYPYKLYASLSAMAYVIDLVHPESTFRNQLKKLIKNCPTGQHKEMGFPKDWEQENFWKKK